MVNPGNRINDLFFSPIFKITRRLKMTREEMESKVMEMYDNMGLEQIDERREMVRRLIQTVPSAELEALLAMRP